MDSNLAVLNAICDALRLPGDVRSVTITASVDAHPLLIVERVFRDSEAIRTVVERFDITPRKEVPT